MTDALEQWRASRQPDPKPRKREVAAGVGMGVVRAVRQCQLCGARTLALDPHHLVPRSQGGDDVVPNFAPLCIFPPACHKRITENDPDALRRLRGTLDVLQVAYILERKGAAWLDRRYPEAAP